VKVKQTRKPSAVIPVVAMSDIAFLLIVFFMLISKPTEEGIELNLPSAKSSKEKEVNQKSISIEKNGQMFLAGRAVNAAELEVELAKMLEKAETDEERVVAIKADEATLYKFAFKAIDIVNKVGGIPALISDTGGEEKPEVRLDTGGTREPEKKETRHGP